MRQVVYFRDHLMNFNNAHEAIEHGFALITEERKANGLFLKSDLTFNTTIANLDQYKGGLGLSMPKMVKSHKQGDQGHAHQVHGT